MVANKNIGREFVGQVHGDKCRIAIVVGRFNDAIGERLLRGAVDTLVRHQVHPGNIDTVWVPGAFEIPLTAWRLGRSGHYDAVICLGAVIRGATPHFDMVANQAASGIAQVALQCDLPVIFGVLTCDTIEQAVERSGTKAGNKGHDAAMAALEMVQLLRTLPRALPDTKEQKDT
jgi:6,7-dimethyl-8-ribityllumazine synthase